MISVHMTTARRYQSGLLQRAVESVLNQSYGDFEFIICDDASEDGTREYLARLAAQDPRVKVFRNERNVNSVSISLGRCMLQASPEAEFITWMFDDSELRPEAFAKLQAAVVAEPELDVVFGVGVCHLRNSQMFRVGGQSEQFIRDNVEFNATLVPNAAILLRREVFDRFGWYDSSIILRRSCDWDLFKRILKGGARFKSINEDMVDEYGELENDSLRNSFTTTFDIMHKFCQLRDQQGWSVSLTSTQYHPVDRIPPGDWTPEELALLYHMIIEYYVSVGHVQKAFAFAERLDGLRPSNRFYLERIKTQAKSGVYPEALGMMGLFAGLLSTRYELAKRDSRIAELEDQLRAPRYRLVDRLNAMLKRSSLVHGFAKKTFRVAKRLVNGAA